VIARRFNKEFFNKIRQHLPFYKFSFGKLGRGTITLSTVCQHERAHLPGGGFTGIAATRKLKVQS
jgi:hypothetical protein